MSNTLEQQNTGDETPPGGEEGYQLPLRLQRLYEEEQRSALEIAEMYSVAPSTIYYWLDKHGIETRDVTRDEPGLRYEMTVDNYMAWTQTPSANKERLFVPVHRLLAVAEWGVDAVSGKHVHHKNGVKWDNRIENLELLAPGEHQKLHAEQSRPTDEELLHDLQVGYQVMGFAPTTADVEAVGEYGHSTYVKRFGSFVEALVAAGIKPRENQIQSDEHAELVEEAFDD